MQSDSSEITHIEKPPTTAAGILLRLGPGLIVAGSIVGSGELIATTATGAQAGFWLLWLILIGCVIKVFVQVELGRYTIVRGRTTMDGLDEVPGPRIAGRGNWLVWYWFIMFLASIAQLGGIVGGVGQALAISAPLTAEGRQYNAYVDHQTQLIVKEAELRLVEQRMAQGSAEGNVADRLREEMAVIRAASQTLREKLDDEGRFVEDPLAPDGKRLDPPRDDQYWAALITVVTAFVLVLGRYGLIQSFATTMVALFTLITIVNLVMLQTKHAWSVSFQDIWNGLSFRLPPRSPDATATPLATALATFGIIGVGASELVSYPYWCLEKGYARFTGPRDSSPDWAERAQGWMRVMRWDAWCSMVVYTFATVAFYLLGAAILGRTGLDPRGTEMIRYLSQMYVPVFGTVAQTLFLFGAFAVLYSTFFVANAAHARVFSDALRVLRFAADGHAAHRRRIRILSGIFPFLCLVFFLSRWDPQELVLFSGLMQALMLPMLAAAALFFRYRRNDPRILPGPLWDTLLWISAAGLLVAGLWAAYTSDLWEKLFG